MDIIAPEERGIYRVSARNILIGAYNPIYPPIQKGNHEMFVFIGMREKWGRRFLTEELAIAIEKVGALKDQRIIVSEHYPSKTCLFCGEVESTHPASCTPLYVLRENMALRHELELLDLEEAD